MRKSRKQPNAAGKSLGPPRKRAARTEIVLPPEGRILTTDPGLDGYVRTFTDGLTFEKLHSRINAAIRGDLANGLQLFEEMEARDGRLRSVSAVRRRSLTGLPWEVVSAADMMPDLQDRALADAAADFIRDQFNSLRSLRKALKHLAGGIGPNLAVLELVWERREGGADLIDLVPAWSSRLRMRGGEPGLVRVVTIDNLIGWPAEGPKWVVHMPEGEDLFPLRRSTSRAQAMIYLAKALAMADWKVFCEVFGMPVRVGTYRSNASEHEKKQLVDMLKNLGTKAWGAFSEAVSLQLLESTSRGVSPYPGFIELCNRETAILWLGGNLLTDTTGGTGTFSAGVKQDEVKDDLRDEDIEAEGETVRRQIIGPMCAAEFWRDDVPLPYFRRNPPETIDRTAEATLIKAAQNAGLAIPRDWAYTRLGIPEPQEGDEVLEPSDAFAAEGTPPPDPLAAAGKEATGQQGNEATGNG